MKFKIKYEELPENDLIKNFKIDKKDFERLCKGDGICIGTFKTKTELIGLFMILEKMVI